MPAIVLRLPSKTFIAGEYLALQGGPTLIAATKPCFEMRISRSQNTKNPFHPESPAGKLWSRYSDFFGHYRFEFMDAHQGQGGFGGSTAEFAFLHVFYQLKESAWTEAEMNYDLHLVWKEYRELSGTAYSTPSGADLIGQLQGGVTFFEKESNRIQRFAWPFTDIGFALIRTQQKLATHTHLDQKPVFESTQARPALELMVASLVQIDSKGFLAGLKSFAHELATAQLVAPLTQSLLQELALNPDILAAKGCGALGADVILIVYATENKAAVLKFLSEKKLPVVATESEMTTGLTKTIENLSAEVSL